VNFFSRFGFAPLLVPLLLSFNGCKKAETPPAPTTTAKAETATKATVAAEAPVKKADAAVPEAVKKLLGRWVRPDGGYVLELKNPDLSGKIEAAYLNPSQNRSINVSRAIWMQGGQGLQVAVELNDASAGYSGATYLLSHDTQGDRLVGQYHQPQMGQTYEIEFIRQNAVPMR